jgi:hypothetical protein
MSEASDYLKLLDKDSPHGYLYSDGYVYPRCRYDVYQGELRLVKETADLTFRFQIIDINHRKKQYGLLLFKDEDRTNPILFATVRYYDWRVQSLREISKSVIDEGSAAVSDMLIKIMHALAYEVIIDLDAPKTRKNYGLEGGRWAHAFTDENMHHLTDSTETSVRSVISSVNSLLHK